MPGEASAKNIAGQTIGKADTIVEQMTEEDRKRWKTEKEEAKGGGLEVESRRRCHLEGHMARGSR
jgi:hypothetical protein